MKYVCSLIFTVITFHVYAQNTEVLDELYGFKGLKFETPESVFIKNIQHDVASSTSAGVTAYNITDTAFLNLGECTIDSLVAVFFNQSLMSFYIITRKKSNADCMLTAMTALLGKAYKGNPSIERYDWVGIKTGAVYAQNKVSKEATIQITSKVVADQQIKENALRQNTKPLSP